MADSEFQRSEEDATLIREYIQTRDTQYLGELYEAYKQRLFLHCVKIVKNEEESKDLASEAFIRAFENIGSFKYGSPFFPWISRIASNLCIDHLRKTSRYRFQPIEEANLANHAGDNPGEMAQDESRHQILGIVKKLRPLQRRCFCLFYIHNLSYKEIAGMTGYPQAKVRSYIQNGRRNFKLHMEKL